MHSILYTTLTSIDCAYFPVSVAVGCCVVLIRSCAVGREQRTKEREEKRGEESRAVSLCRVGQSHRIAAQCRMCVTVGASVTDNAVALMMRLQPPLLSPFRSLPLHCDRMNSIRFFPSHVAVGVFFFLCTLPHSLSMRWRYFFLRRCPHSSRSMLFSRPSMSLEWTRRRSH